MYGRITATIRRPAPRHVMLPRVTRSHPRAVPIRSSFRLALVMLLATIPLPGSVQAQWEGDFTFGPFSSPEDFFSLRRLSDQGAAGEGAYESIRKAMYENAGYRPSDILAFEDNRNFTFAAGVVLWTLPKALTPPKPAQPPQYERRVLLFKPGIIVLDDDVRVPPRGFQNLMGDPLVHERYPRGTPVPNS